MGTYISIKSTVNAFRYGIDPIPEWFDKIFQRTNDYYDSYICFVMSRFNGIMSLYDTYDSISVDDVRDMVKDINEDKLIIQYCS